MVSVSFIKIEGLVVCRICDPWTECWLRVGGCGMASQCCSAPEEGCCMGEQQCYYVWEKKCGPQAQPYCRFTIINI